MDWHEPSEVGYWGFGEAGKGCRIFLWEMKAIVVHLPSNSHPLPGRPCLGDRCLASRSRAPVCRRLLFVCLRRVEMILCEDLGWLGVDSSPRSEEGGETRKEMLPPLASGEHTFPVQVGGSLGSQFLKCLQLMAKYAISHGWNWICSPWHVNISSIIYESRRPGKMELTSLVLILCLLALWRFSAISINSEDIIVSELIILKAANEKV